MAATESSEGDTPPHRVGAQPRARAGRGQEKRSPDAQGRLGGWVAVGSARGWASPAWLLPPSLLEARGGGLHAGKSAVSRWPGPVPGLAPSHPRPFPGCGWRAGAGPDPLRDPRRGASRDPERGHAGEGWTQLPRGGWQVAEPASCSLPGAIGREAPGKPLQPAWPPRARAWVWGLRSQDGGAGPGQPAPAAVCGAVPTPDLWDQGPGPGTQGSGSPLQGGSRGQASRGCGCEPGPPLREARGPPEPCRPLTGCPGPSSVSDGRGHEGVLSTEACFPGRGWP